MTETERQRHLDTAELVDESAGNAAVTADLPPDDPVRAGGETRSQWRDVWRQFRSHRGAMVALVLFVLVLLFVSIGPWLWTIDPTYVDIRARNSGFVAAHPLGTDQLGRDMLARLMAG
ncbi:MAG TPA: ABC transporter permease, partial [Paracoccus sp.]|nr:ABC transporter permease [Paracoccus sp. (in: a-proteobacteria)]